MSCFVIIYLDILSHRIIYIYYNKWLYFYIKPRLYNIKGSVVISLQYYRYYGASCIYYMQYISICNTFFRFFLLISFKVCKRHAGHAALLPEYPRVFDIVAHSSHAIYMTLFQII